MSLNQLVLPLRRAAPCLVIFGLCLGAWVNSASAVPLNLTTTHPGDVTTHFTDVQYTLDADPLTGTLTAVGFPDEFDVNSQGFTSSSFSLSLKVLRATGAVVSGSVTITGDTDGVPHYTGTLLTGDITQFGFKDAPLGSPGAGNIFEFAMNVTGGALAPVYYTDGRAGIIMNIANGSAVPAFTGVFTSAFHNDGFGGFSDTFPTDYPVPEPSTCLLLAIAILPLALRPRRQG